MAERLLYARGRRRQAKTGPAVDTLVRFAVASEGRHTLVNAHGHGLLSGNEGLRNGLAMSTVR